MPVQSFKNSVVRPQDLLLLNLDFQSVDFTPPQGGQPGQVTGGANSFLIVHFQAQHIAEEAFYQAGGNIQQPGVGDEIPSSPGQVRSILAGSSRVVFRIPPGETFPYTVEEVLQALPRLPLNVPPVSSFRPPGGCTPAALLFQLLRIPPPPAIQEPGGNQTAIEAPYRLLLSPDDRAGWAHEHQPVEHDGAVELWHTRLLGEDGTQDPNIRAVWSPDFLPNNLQDDIQGPFRMSLTGRKRNEIVHLTSNYNLGLYRPVPLQTEFLNLSALGASLKLQGDWDPTSVQVGGETLKVEQWRHELGLGRDQFVKVVTAGYLLPFGHRASLIEITERKFFYREDAEIPGMIAYLYMRRFILVRELVRSYGNRDALFQQVRFKTKVTPNLVDAQTPDPVHSPFGLEGFWPRVVDGQTISDFRFHLLARDWEEREIELTIPLFFVSSTQDSAEATKIGNNQDSAVLKHYNDLSLTSPRRRADLGGQQIAFAPPDKQGDTSLETDSIAFGGEPVTNQVPHFRPVMSEAGVDIPAVKRLLGKDSPSKITWEPQFIAAAGQSIGNKGQIFARVANTALAFDTDKSGGLVAPDLSITALSRSLGPTGGPAEALRDGSFNPVDIFPDIKLMGGLKIKDLIREVIFGSTSAAGDRLPQFVSVQDGDTIRTSYTWKLNKDDLIISDLFTPLDGAAFTLEAVAEKKIDAVTPPEFNINGSLTNFSVVLIPPKDGDLHLVEITFDSVSFRAEPGKDVDVSVELAGIAFKGILEFVDKIREYIPLDGFSDPPYLDLVGPPNPGVNVGFTFGIPTIGVGIMTMQNITLAAGFYLPFGDKPMNFHFAFCERQQPFILTVSLFGGGGFFGIDIGLNGVEMIEAALEFGASATINLGVASGSATMMAGFYFQMAGDAFELTGYFRAAGSLSVLGIITVSLEFYLGLTYANKLAAQHPGTLWGQAKLTVKIEILFFSTSVSISMEREFAGSDPTFHEMVDADQWALYCDAFADYA